MVSPLVPLRAALACGQGGRESWLQQTRPEPEELMSQRVVAARG
jgi:hypothetical protein